LSATSFHKLFEAASSTTEMGAADKSEVLEQLVKLAVKGGKLSADQHSSVLAALVEREGLGSTGIGSGIAIPHVKTDEVSETITAIGVSKSGVDFNSVDGENCTVFFLLISPKSEAETHLEILRWVSKLARNADFVRFVRHSKNAREIVGLLKEMGA